MTREGGGSSFVLRHSFVIGHSSFFRHSSRDRAMSDRLRVVHPPASLGVIGGGQLGRMFVQAAQRMGYSAGVLAATDDAPAAQVAHWSVVGPPDHLPALRTFAERPEAITAEFENVSAPAPPRPA